MQTTAVSARPVSQTQIHFCHVWVDVKLWIFKVQSSVIHNPSGQALYFCTFFQTKLVEFCVCCPRWFLKMTRRNHWRALDSLGKSRTLPLSGSKNWIWNHMENGCFGRKRHGRDFRLQSISRTAVGFPACRETFGTRYLSILNTERERRSARDLMFLTLMFKLRHLVYSTPVTYLMWYAHVYSIYILYIHLYTHCMRDTEPSSSVSCASALCLLKSATLKGISNGRWKGLRMCKEKGIGGRRATKCKLRRKREICTNNVQIYYKHWMIDTRQISMTRRGGIASMVRKIQSTGFDTTHDKRSTKS